MLRDARLVDAYDVYQRLMDLWAASMQDDVYMISAEGWKAVLDGQPNTDLIPVDLVKATYFSKEVGALEESEAKRDAVTREIEEAVEEHGGDDGLLADARNDADKINKASVTARLKVIAADRAAAEERQLLERMLKLWERESAAAKAAKDAAKALELTAEADAKLADVAAAAEKPAGDAKPKGVSDEFKKIMEVDVICVELGVALLGLADKKTGGDLLDRVTGVRRNFARDLGMVIPPIAIRDNLDLENSEYRFMLRGREVARGKVLLKHWLAMNVSNIPVNLRGVSTTEPVFGIKATWVDDEEKRTAEIHGFTVVDPSSVLITHLAETIKRSSYLVLSRQDVQTLLDTLKETSPVLVTDVIPEQLTVGAVQRVLQNLLREGISIRNLVPIMETLGDIAAVTKNPDELSEYVRRRLGTYFVAEYESAPGVVKAVTLEPRLEQLLTGKVHRTQFDVGLVIDPQMAQYLLQELTKRMTEMAERGLVPVLITTSELRLAFRRFFEPSLSKLVVLSYQELPQQTEIQNLAIIMPPPAAAGAVASK